MSRCCEARRLFRAELVALIKRVDETAIVDHAHVVRVPDFQRTDKIGLRIVRDIEMVEICHGQRLRIRLRAKQRAPLACRYSISSSPSRPIKGATSRAIIAQLCFFSVLKKCTASIKAFRNTTVVSSFSRTKSMFAQIVVL